MNNNQQCLEHQGRNIQFIQYDIQNNSDVSFKCVDCLDGNNRYNGKNIQLQEFQRQAKEYIQKFQQLEIWQQKQTFPDFKTSFLQEKTNFRYQILLKRIVLLKDIENSLHDITLDKLKILVYSMERNEYSYLEREFKILMKELQPIIFRNSENRKFYECIGEFKDENNGQGWCRCDSDIKEGIIVKGQLEGYGYYKQGFLEMEGWFIGGKLNGKGQLTQISRNAIIIKEVGYFKNNELNGSGIREINGDREEGMFLNGVKKDYIEDITSILDFTQPQPHLLKQINQQYDRSITKYVCIYCHLQNAVLANNELYYYCYSCEFQQCKKCLGQYTKHHNKKYNIFRCPQTTNYPYFKRLIYMFPRLFILLILILWAPFSNIHCDDLIILIASLVLVVPFLSQIFIGIPGNIHRYLCS